MNEQDEKIKQLPKRILGFLAIIIILFSIGILGFIFLKKYDFEVSLIKTLESFAFMFSEDVGYGKGLQIFLAIFGVMTLGWIISSVFNLIFEGHISEYLKTSRFLSRMKKMKNHYIIAGGGRVGEELAKEFAASKKQYVIIEKDDKKISKIEKNGFQVIRGDVTDSDYSDLVEAGIKNAKAIILAMPETEKNLLVTMTAKELNPKIDVYARSDNPAFIEKLKKAGAKLVINPELAAAEKFLETIK